MLTSRTFMKRTRAGAVMKVVREHYLRDDISCGAAACSLCGGAGEEDGQAPRSLLEAQPSGAASNLCPNSHYLLLDTNLLLHQVRGCVVLRDRAREDWAGWPMAEQKQLPVALLGVNFTLGAFIPF